VDENPVPGRFILTGSQQFELMDKVSQSLAGRTTLLRLLPLTIREIEASGHPLPLFSQMHTGFYPRLIQNGLNPSQAMGEYFSTYVERDLRQLSVIHDFRALLASFSGFGLNASLGTEGADFGITFNFGTSSKTPAVSLTSLGELLKSMDEIALKGGWNIVFEMDEFQQISSLETGHAIEAQIRDAVQYARATAFIFLGSNRHLLEQMFSDQSRPFYNLCRIIRLNRIAAEDFIAGIKPSVMISEQALTGNRKRWRFY